MPRGKAHPPEFRAAVVAALVTGAPMGDVCREFDVAEQTARDWQQHAIRSSCLVRGAGDAARTRAVLDLEELVGRLVAASIETLVVQARLAAERDWFLAQDARGISEYRGVEFDRLLRLLRGFERRDGGVDRPEALDGTVVDATARSADDGV